MRSYLITTTFNVGIVDETALSILSEALGYEPAAGTPQEMLKYLVQVYIEDLILDAYAILDEEVMREDGLESGELHASPLAGFGPESTDHGLI